MSLQKWKCINKIHFHEIHKQGNTLFKRKHNNLNKLNEFVNVDTVSSRIISDLDANHDRVAAYNNSS